MKALIIISSLIPLGMLIILVLSVIEHEQWKNKNKSK